MEDVIGRPDLMILTSGYNHAFIHHYNVRSRLVAVEDLDWRFRFGDGRELSFTLTPYCHSQGSICTLDTATRTLFTSDLFGTFGETWELFHDLLPECGGAHHEGDCGTPECVLGSMAGFHRAIMTSNAALRFALRRLSALDFRVIAPQHGSVVRRPADIARVFDLLSRLEGVGIDGVLAREEPG
jgi:flavorubredoxin